MHDDCEAAIQVQNFRGQQWWLVGLENPYPVGDLRNVLYQYEQARARFLATNADALLLVEHDNILPDGDAAQRLYDTHADVVYGCYMLRHGSHVVNLWRYEGDRNLGQSWSLYPDEFRKLRERTTCVRVSGVGFGCVLMRRNVVERFPFRAGEPTAYAPDIPFAQDVLRAGIVSLARLDVPVAHYHDGVRLAPFTEHADMSKVQAQQTVNVLVEGEVLRMVAGHVYDLPAAVIPDLVRANYVQILAPEVASIAPSEQAVMPQGKRKRAG